MPQIKLVCWTVWSLTAWTDMHHSGRLRSPDHHHPWCKTWISPSYSGHVMQQGGNTEMTVIVTTKSWKQLETNSKSQSRKQRKHFLRNCSLTKIISETWRAINKILHPNPLTVKVNPGEVNSYFNQTSTRTTGGEAWRITDEFLRTLPEQRRTFDLRGVTYNDVMKVINNLRSDCSTGYDNIPAKFVKPVADYLASPMTNIINHCINTSTVPSEWKTSRICPVPKIKNPAVHLRVPTNQHPPNTFKSLWACHPPATDRDYWKRNDLRPTTIKDLERAILQQQSCWSWKRTSSVQWKKEKSPLPS